MSMMVRVRSIGDSAGATLDYISSDYKAVASAVGPAIVDRDDPLRDILAAGSTAARNGRPYRHITISYSDNERLDPQSALDDLRTLCEHYKLGWWVAFAHGDADHRHVHALVAAVAPDLRDVAAPLRIVDLYNIDRVLPQIFPERHLTRGSGEGRNTLAVGRARDARVWNGYHSALHILREDLADAQVGREIDVGLARRAYRRVAALDKRGTARGWIAKPLDPREPAIKLSKLLPAPVRSRLGPPLQEHELPQRDLPTYTELVASGTILDRSLEDRVEDLDATWRTFLQEQPGLRSDLRQFGAFLRRGLSPRSADRAGDLERREGRRGSKRNLASKEGASLSASGTLAFADRMEALIEYTEDALKKQKFEQHFQGLILLSSIYTNQYADFTQDSEPITDDYVLKEALIAREAIGAEATQVLRGIAALNCALSADHIKGDRGVGHDFDAELAEYLESPAEAHALLSAVRGTLIPIAGPNGELAAALPSDYAFFVDQSTASLALRAIAGDDPRPFLHENITQRLVAARDALLAQNGHDGAMRMGLENHIASFQGLDPNSAAFASVALAIPFSKTGAIGGQRLQSPRAPTHMNTIGDGTRSAQEIPPTIPKPSANTIGKEMKSDIARLRAAYNRDLAATLHAVPDAASAMKALSEARSALAENATTGDAGATVRRLRQLAVRQEEAAIVLAVRGSALDSVGTRSLAAWLDRHESDRSPEERASLAAAMIAEGLKTPENVDFSYDHSLARCADLRAVKTRRGIEHIQESVLTHHKIELESKAIAHYLESLDGREHARVGAVAEADGRYVVDSVPSDQQIEMALRLAQARYGTVDLQGDPKFLERALKAAATMGIDITNPELRQDYERLRAEAEIERAKAPALSSPYVITSPTVDLTKLAHGAERVKATHDYTERAVTEAFQQSVFTKFAAAKAAVNYDVARPLAGVTIGHETTVLARRKDGELVLAHVTGTSDELHRVAIDSRSTISLTRDGANDPFKITVHDTAEGQARERGRDLDAQPLSR